MKTIILSSTILLLPLLGTSQKPDLIRDEVSKYGIEKIDTLVDIGSGNGVINGDIHQKYPKIYFILEDINPKYQRTKTSWMERVTGTEDSIPLPSSRYKHVKCRNTLHEFTKPSEMLKEIYRILAADGILILVEAIPRKDNIIDPYCKKKLLTKDEIIDMVTANGFRLVSVDVTTYPEKNKKAHNFNILKFSK